VPGHSRLRVAVVGYGSGGQAAALLLSRDGHRVTVFERTPALGPVGAGFLLQPTGLSVLWEMGLLGDAMAHGAVVRRLYGCTDRGRPVMDMRYAELAPTLFGLGLQRAALFSILDAAWDRDRDVRCGHPVTGIDPDAGTLVDAGGRRHGPFDLVVVADGAASGLRGGIAGPRLDRPYPWGAWWCLVPAEGWPQDDELQQRYVRARRMAGMLPVGGRPGQPTPMLSFFWSLPVPDLVAGRVDPEGWRAELAALWPAAAERLRDVAVPDGLAQARYRDTVHRQWWRGRAVLLGDAAHAMSPQLGQGVNMALLDAQALRDALRAETALPAALARYQAGRRAHVAVYHAWSRWLTPLFQSRHDHLAWWRDRLMHPLSRLPVARGQMLRVLTGTRQGWLGRRALPLGFVDALREAGALSPAAGSPPPAAASGRAAGSRTAPSGTRSSS